MFRFDRRVPPPCGNAAEQQLPAVAAPAAFARRVRGAPATISDCSVRTARVDDINLSSRSGAAAYQRLSRAHRPHIMALTCRERAVPLPGSMPPPMTPPALMTFTCRRWTARPLSAFCRASHRPHFMALDCREWAVPKPGSMSPQTTPPALMTFGCRRWAVRHLSAFRHAQHRPQHDNIGLLSVGGAAGKSTSAARHTAGVTAAPCPLGL